MGNKETKGGFPKRAVAWAGGIIGAIVVAVIRDGSLAGLSRLLTTLYASVWLAIVIRYLIHLSEGYHSRGLGRPMIYELILLIAGGASTVILLIGDNPQIPLLVFFSGSLALLFFLCATKLEEARVDEMEKQGVEIRRATDALRQSGFWRWTCRRFAQVDFEFARRVRKFLAGQDSAPGSLSLAAGIALLIPAGISLVAVLLVFVSMIVPVRVTPPGARVEDQASEQTATQRGVERDTESTTTGPRVNAADSPTAERRESNGIRCGGERDFEGVPEPEQSSLQLGWRAVPGTTAGPMEALGYEIAGCPGTARPIPGLKGAFYAPGYCGDELRALVIAPRGMEHPLVLLEQAAQFALPLILDGHFEGAVDRFAVGTGDAYIIDSDMGSYVLFRDHTSNGELNRPEERGDGCAGFSDQDVRYTLISPALLEAWRVVAAISVGGVYPIDYARETDGSESVVFRSPEGIVAEGACSISTMTCAIDIGEEQIHGRRGGFISENEVRTLVEP